MLVAPHFLVGAAVAAHTHEFWPTALAVLTCHFVMDHIPHRDSIGGFHLSAPNFILRLGIDATITLALFFSFVPIDRWVYIFSLSVISILPDLIEAIGLFWPAWYQQPIMKQFHYWHTEILQSNSRGLGWLWGLFPQIILIVVAIYFITKPLA